MEKITIRDMWKLNELEEMCSLMYCKKEDFYGYYFEKPIEWLIENEGKIRDDFKELEDELAWHILVNSKYLHEEKSNAFSKMLRTNNYELLYTCIHPDYYKEEKNSEIVKLMEELKKMPECYAYFKFEEIKRK